MTTHNFCLSATFNVSSPTNVETYFTDANTDPPSVLPDQLVPYLGAVKSIAGSGKARRQGLIEREWHWPSMLHDDFNAFVMAIWGNFITESVAATMITLDETRRYARFNVYVDKPYIGEHFRSANGGYYIADVVMPYRVIASLGEFTAEFSEEFNI